jgi:hypothetical protein
MIFYFIKPKIVLDCFTTEETIIKTNPVDFAVKHMPDWWKNLSNEYIDDFFPRPNMNNCAGMNDFYKFSVAIPLWSDFALHIENEKFRWQFSDRKTSAGSHNLDRQADGFLPKNYSHLKIKSPWQLSCKKDINWMWNTPLYNFNKYPEIIVPPAIVNYNNLPTSNINLLFRNDEPKTILLKQGTPLVLLTPLTDKKIKIVRHLIDEKEFEKQNRTNIAFTNVYKKIVKQKEKYSSCPFKNHTK